MINREAETMVELAYLMGLIRATRNIYQSGHYSSSQLLAKENDGELEISITLGRFEYKYYLLFDMGMQFLFPAKYKELVSTSALVTLMPQILSGTVVEIPLTLLDSVKVELCGSFEQFIFFISFGQMRPSLDKHLYTLTIERDWPNTAAARELGTILLPRLTSVMKDVFLDSHTLVKQLVSELNELQKMRDDQVLIQVGPSVSNGCFIVHVSQTEFQTVYQCLVSRATVEDISN